MKNNIYKKWYFWLILVTFIFIILLLIFILNNNSGVGTAGICKDEFDEITIGSTTNFELNSIIDQKDEWNDDTVYNRCVEKISESSENHIYTYVYKYYGEKGGYAIITLQADYTNGYFYNDVIVTKKENHNLK